MKYCLFLFSMVAFGQAPTGCSDAKSNQFDFWLGDWDVYAGGQLVGANQIAPILGGCVLQETWAGKGGSTGSSFNYYNPSTKKWHQYWVWQNGTTLPLLSGGYEDGKMTLIGEQPGKDGKPVKTRIIWHNNPDGTVRQHWEQSKDAGKTWKTAFDGLYKKKTKTK